LLECYQFLASFFRNRKKCKSENNGSEKIHQGELNIFLKENEDKESFAGRGSPAFMSPKEPAIRALREKYHESFAFTESKNRPPQVHIFLIRLGLWSLVLTLTPRDVGSDEIRIGDALDLVAGALSGRNPELEAKLDLGVRKSLERIGEKVSQFGRKKDKL
jgi:hypothetical protein